MTTGVTRNEADERSFRNAIRERNASAARVAAILISIINPCFGVLDRWLIPEHADELLFIRVGLECLAFGVLLLVWKAPTFVRRHDFVVGLGMMLLTTWSIEVMVFMHQGYSSAYYAGVCLVTVCTGYLFLVTMRAAITFHVLTYLPFIAPGATGFVAISDWMLFLPHNLFLLSTILIVAVSQRFQYQLVEREFFGNLDLQRTQESLEEALGSLRKLDELKSQFFNNITHELRTPLTMILAPVESMRSGDLGELTEDQTEIVRSIWKNGIRLLKLINDLLDLARMSENYLYLQVEDTSFKETLAQVVDYARPLAARKDIELRFEVGDEPSGLVCDAEKLERAVINLISNALKFTEPGGEVRIELTTKDRAALIAVHDNGVGIPNDKINTIFQRFSQADASVTRRYGGTGIGLAFAESIVELHGGQIEVESTLGKGSTFTIRLPLGSEHLDPAILDRRARRDPGEQDHGRRAEDQGPREWAARLTDMAEYRFLNIEEVTDRRRVRRGQDDPRAARVLVVEDNLDVAEFIHMQLQNDYTVLLAGNGTEGLRLAREKSPDVIVTDYMMPEMDGLSMLRELRSGESTVEVPVIMLTAKAQITDRLEAREAGADVYMSKPFNPRELRSAIEQQLKKRGRQIRTVLKSNLRTLEIVSAGLSHEINNPLGYIRTAAAVVKEGVDEIVRGVGELEAPAETREKLARAGDRLERMCGTIDLGVRRIERVVEVVRRYAQEGYPHARLPVAVDPAIRDLAELVGPRGDKRVDVHLDLKAGDAEISCIAEELHQAISNVVQNAVDAVGDQGTVLVRTRADAREVVIEVTDDGPGINPELRDRVFTPFFTTKAPGAGMGLGLAITQRVVHEAGGEIRVDGAVGEGTTFRMSMPRFVESDRHAPHAPAEEPRTESLS